MRLRSSDVTPSLQSTYNAFEKFGPVTVKVVAEELGLSTSFIHKQVKRLVLFDLIRVHSYSALYGCFWEVVPVVFPKDFIC